MKKRKLTNHFRITIFTHLTYQRKLKLQARNLNVVQNLRVEKLKAVVIQHFMADAEAIWPKKRIYVSLDVSINT